MPPGDALRGFQMYHPPSSTNPNGATLDGAFACATCHAVPTGMATDRQWNGSSFVPPNPPLPSPNGEKHHGLVSVDGSSSISMKVPHLRNQYEKVGYEATQLESRGRLRVRE